MKILATTLASLFFMSSVSFAGVDCNKQKKGTLKQKTSYDVSANYDVNIDARLNSVLGTSKSRSGSK